MERSVRQAVLNLARQALTWLFVAWLIYYLATNWERFRALVDLSWYHAIGIGVGVLLTWLITSTQAFLLLRAEGVRIGFGEHFLLFVASVLVNYLPLRAGTIMRIQYLRVVHDLPYGRFGSLMGVRFVVLLVTTGLLGIAGMIILWQRERRFSLELAIPYAALLIGALVLSRLPIKPLSRREGRLRRLWSDFGDGVAAHRSRRRLMFVIAVLIVLQYAAIGWRLYLSFDAVQQHVEPYLMLILAPLTTVVALLALTMGSLGAREGVIGYATAATSHDFAGAVFAASVDRAVLMVATVTIGLVGLQYVRSQMERKRASIAHTEAATLEVASSPKNGGTTKPG